MSKSRGWTFTLNNYTPEDVKNIEGFECQFLFQEETGESGTKHLQGMLYFKNAVSFNSIRNLLPRAHIEKMKNKIASIKYCSKEDTRSGKIYSNFNFSSEVGTLAQCVREEKKSRPIELVIRDNLDYLNIAMDLYINNRELFHRLIDDWTQQHVIELMGVDIGQLAAWHL